MPGAPGDHGRRGPHLVLRLLDLRTPETPATYPYKNVPALGPLGAPM